MNQDPSLEQDIGRDSPVSTHNREQRGAWTKQLMQVNSAALQEIRNL